MKNKIHVHYDEEGDMLELRIGKPQQAYYEEINNGVFERRDERTNEWKGFAIFNFKKRSAKLKDIQVKIPKEVVL